MNCKSYYYNHYFGECICSKSGKPCAVACINCAENNPKEDFIEGN